MLPRRFIAIAITASPAFSRDTAHGSRRSLKVLARIEMGLVTFDISPKPIIKFYTQCPRALDESTLRAVSKIDRIMAIC